MGQLNHKSTATTLDTSSRTALNASVMQSQLRRDYGRVMMKQGNFVLNANPAPVGRLDLPGDSGLAA